MVLNWIWIGFFLIAFITATVRLVVFGDLDVFTSIISSTFEMAKTGATISIGLIGVLTLWLGLMKVGEAGGVVTMLGRIVRPLFHRLFPGLPPDHPAHGSMIMNFAANMLGLDNAATPLGLKAMQQLQEVNETKDTASNAQIMFLVLNTSSLTLIPLSVMVFRAEQGAANPADIFIPILLTTFFSSVVGLVTVALVQRINLFDKVILAWLLGAGAVVTGIILLFTSLPRDQIEVVSTLAANVILFSIIASFVGLAAYKRVNVYDTFIEGAKEGFGVAVMIIPYLIAILVAVGVFRASGAMDGVISAVAAVFEFFGFDTSFVEALPTAMMKPLSGGGARGMMVDAMQQHGADSFVGRLACTFQGATDTTFYIIVVYFGSVSVRKTRHAVPCGLAADLAAIIAGIFIAYLFFAE